MEAGRKKLFVETLDAEVSSISALLGGVLPSPLVGSLRTARRGKFAQIGSNYRLLLCAHRVRSGPQWGERKRVSAIATSDWHGFAKVAGEERPSMAEFNRLAEQHVFGLCAEDRAQRHPPSSLICCSYNASQLSGRVRFRRFTVNIFHALLSRVGRQIACHQSFCMKTTSGCASCGRRGSMALSRCRPLNGATMSSGDLRPWRKVHPPAVRPEILAEPGLGNDENRDSLRRRNCRHY